MRMWQAAGWPGDRTLSSVEHQTLEKFHGVLAEFGALDAVTGRMNLQQALACLRDLLSDTPFEPETASAAVTVIDSATSAGMHFDALWVTGLDADRIPAPVNPDALIPLELQRTAGIPEATARGVLQQATTQLQRWTSSAPKVMLSWPQRDGDVRSRTQSAARSASWQQSIERRKPAAAASLRRVLFEQRPTLHTIRDDRAPPLSRSDARGGARTVELQSRCPFRAQAEIRLRAEPMPRVSLGVEPVDRGALLHRVLAEVWATFRTQEQLLAIEDSALERQVRDSAQRHAAQALPGDVRYRHRLAALEIESAVRQVIAAARAGEAASAVRGAPRGGIRAVRDRRAVDHAAAGSHRRAGVRRRTADRLQGRRRASAARLARCAARPTAQSAAAAVRARSRRAVARARVRVLTPGAVEYRGWSDGSDVGAGVWAYPSGVRIDLGDPGDWQALMHYWRFTLTRLAERYVAGEASVDPLPFECTTCHLSTFCRINELALSEPEPEFTPDD